MTSIVVAKDVRARLSLPDDEGINNSIKSCIIGATIRASSLLKTDFESQVRRSIFYVDPRFEVSKGGLYVFRLVNGFVKTNVEVNVYVGDSFEDASTGEVLENVYVDYEKGWVLLLAESVEGKYVCIEAGFGFDAINVAPDWLKEIILGLTIKMLSSQQISDGKPQLSNVVPVLDQHVLALVDDHKRSSSICISPLYSELVVTGP